MQVQVQGKVQVWGKVWVWAWGKVWVQASMSLILWYDSLTFYFRIFSISALMLTYYDAQYWHDASHKLREPTWSCMCNAWLLLSLYCLWHLYSVMPRRWTNDHQLGWFSEQAGQCSLHPPQHLSHSFYLLKVSLVPCPSLFSFVGILYFVISFWAVSQLSANTISMP